VTVTVIPLALAVNEVLLKALIVKVPEKTDRMF
jgi:hypothetical protein